MVLNREAIKIFIAVLLLFTTVLPASGQPFQSRFVPPDGKILLFIGQDRDSIDAYAGELNVVPAGVMFYAAIQTLSGLQYPVEYGAGFQDAPHLLKEYPASALQVGLYMVDASAGVLQGKYDENIFLLGQWLKETRRPVYLRIGYEFDLPQNGYQPGEYKESYRYIVDRLREQGVDNVAYVWHSYAVLNPVRPLMDWYPGDEYVDWFAVSFFNAYNRGNMAIIANLAKKHRKPLMIAEAAPPKNRDVSHGAASWRQWYVRFFDFIRDYDVKAVSYINCDWQRFPMFQGESWGDSRVQQNQIVRDGWVRELNDDKYLRSSSLLFKELGLSAGRTR